MGIYMAYMGLYLYIHTFFGNNFWKSNHFLVMVFYRNSYFLMVRTKNKLSFNFTFKVNTSNSYSYRKIDKKICCQLLL